MWYFQWVRGGCGAWVSSLVRELKSHMPCGKKERKKEGKKGRKGRKEGRKRKKEGRKERKRKKGRKKEGRWTIYFKGPASGRMQVKKEAAWMHEHKYHDLVE